METIKIYDVNALLLEEENLEAFQYKKVAIFEGLYGVVVADYEAVHMAENLVTDSVSIDANTPTDGKHIAILPNRRCFVIIKDILEKAPYEEMIMTEFFTRRNYNSRCRGNWTILINSLKDIGFDLTGYFESDIK